MAGLYNINRPNSLLRPSLTSMEDSSFCMKFVTTGERPQNFINNTDPQSRFRELPKLNSLIQQKSSLLKSRNHPPVYIKEDLKKFDLGKLGKFDVLLIDPPWEEYETRGQALPSYLQKAERYKSWTVDELMKLNIEGLAESPSFMFLWVGSQHLDDGRELFKKWGFKRCEDVVWIKTNKIRDKSMPSDINESILQRVKQHCLVGFKGDVKKASQQTFIHPNIDIDVIVDEQPEQGSLKKPFELYDIIERFCLGRKRIQLFGQTHNIRNGWLTVGKMINESNFIAEEYNSWFMEGKPSNGFNGGRLLGTNNLIESLRPKEPPKENKQEEKILTPVKMSNG